MKYGEKVLALVLAAVLIWKIPKGGEGWDMCWVQRIPLLGF